MQTKTKWIVGVSSALFMLLFVSLSLYIYKQTDKIIYFFKSPESWQSFRQATCTPNRLNYTFADLRPNHPDDPKQPLELTCQDAVTRLASHHYIPNQRGVKIHYMRYPGDHIKSDTPLLLFVPGIAENYVMGTRYIEMAKRLNFELVIMEASNHGHSGNDGIGAAYGCREKDDLKAVLQALSQTHSQRKIMIFGSSMGGMTLANLGPELQPFRKQIKAVVLESTPTDLESMLTLFAKKLGIPSLLIPPVMGLTEWRSGYDYATCAPLNKMKSLDLPVFVSIAQNDHLVPSNMASTLFEALPPNAKHKLKVYPAGGHSTIWNGQPKIYEQDLLAFWQASLASGREKKADNIAKNRVGVF